MNPLPTGPEPIGALLFWAPPRHPPAAAPFLPLRQDVAGNFWVARKGISMARINRLLRSAPSRIGKRIAQLVAIAAASLPDAGA
jgi:hypothetical protein